MKRTITVMVMCVAMMLMGAYVRADDAQNRCRRIGHKWVDFWNGGDVTKAFDVFTEDIVYEDVTFGAVSRGADEFTAFATFVFTTFPQSTFTLVKSSYSGQQGFIEWIWNVVDTPGKGLFGTGLSIEVRGVAIVAIHGNRISRNSDYYDYAIMLRQLGKLPPGL
jgi:steroid delta-isomerase-like uncharacterized protein